MKKSFSQNRIQKKNRGVAVIFTLGILGLLTVMALGFASTALLNRKIADNTSNQAYARHIAKNIALQRALFALRQNVHAATVYSTEISTDPDNKDFLYNMDTIMDGVELYRVTNGTSFKTDAARWQYVREPGTNGRILGRYAYAVIPDIGRMDPNIHLGTSADAASRFGNSVQELSIPAGTSGSTDWKTSLTGKLTDPNRWSSFREIFKVLNKDITSPSEDVRNIFSDGISLKNSKTPETFWLDLNNDGQRTANEMFLRFNMTRDWTATTVDDLIGTSGTSLTLDNAGGEKSISFIPWLKNWDYLPAGTTNWTADLIKKQIAANIIQYNRAADQPTVTDKPSADDATWTWLTDPPNYAGIGRHPMLNEIGFLIRVRTEVIPEFVSKDDEAGTIKYKYTPIFYITVDAGAELIYPFGPASSLQNSKIRFSGKTRDSRNNVIMKFVLRKFLKQGESPDPQTTVDALGDDLIVGGVLNSKMIHSHLDRIIIRTTGETENLISSSTQITQMNDASEGFQWSNFDLSLESGDWNASPAYTKAEKFWKEGQTNKQQTLRMQIRSITIETKNSVGTANEIAAAMARRMTIEWEDNFTPGTVVMKYNEKQRDVVRQLKEIAIPNNHTSGLDCDNKTIRGWSDMAEEKVWFVAYQTTDPLVNH
ncbi:MAG: hypothetical protein J5858_05930, partial [Lentisphaeria bacterium]|nr:hypothetical protein [Lentisphaeria bacterium]